MDAPFICLHRVYFYDYFYQIYPQVELSKRCDSFTEFCPVPFNTEFTDKYSDLINEQVSHECESESQCDWGRGRGNRTQE